VRRDAHFQVQVAGRLAAMAGHALPREADELARVHARRDLHAERAVLQLRMALCIDRLRTQRDLALGAVERVFDGDLDGRVVVFAARAVVLARGAAPLGLAEHRREELAEVRMIGRPLARAAVELEARVPPRRRLEVALGAAAARDAIGQRVVGRALFLVAQHVLGLVDLAHALLGVGLLADVGVVLAGELAVGLAHLVVRRGALDAQCAVVVLEFHGVGGFDGRRTGRPG
jgi:hypothetical protein